MKGRGRLKRELRKPKKKALRARRSARRNAWEELRDIVRAQARLSLDGLAAGKVVTSGHALDDDGNFVEGTVRKHTQSHCSAEGYMERGGRWVPPVPPLYVTPTVLDPRLDGETLPSEIGGREGYWEGRFFRPWKKIHWRDLERLLACEWVPNKMKDPITLLGDIARRS